MKITTFQIKFDNPQGVFNAGALVSGHVHLTLAKPMKMRSKYYFHLSSCLSEINEHTWVSQICAITGIDMISLP